MLKTLQILLAVAAVLQLFGNISAFRGIISGTGNRFLLLAKRSITISSTFANTPDIDLNEQAGDYNDLGLNRDESFRPEMTILTDDTFHDTVITSDALSFVLFGSNWCAPCKTMKQTLQKLMIKNKQPNIKFYQIDADFNHDTAEKMLVRSIPTTLVLKNGKVVSEIIGSLPEEVVANQLTKYTL